MSRTITQTSSSGSAVAAGSSVLSSVFTTTGFSAGDYVYTLPTGGVGTRATGNALVGLDTPYVGTTWISKGLQSSPFRTVSYGAYIDQDTYTGTTRTLGQVLISANTLNSTVSKNNKSCTLANGNVVLMYNNAANLYFKIIDSTGATVVAETTLTTTYYSTSNHGAFACCTLTNGDIQFAYKTTANNSATTQISVVQYTATGSVSRAAANLSTSTITQLDSFCMAALSGGGCVITGTNGNNTASTSAAWIVVTATQTLIGSGTALSSTALGEGTSFYFGCVGLPASYGTNIWACFIQNTTSVSTGTGFAKLAIYSGSTYVTNITTTVNQGNTGGFTFNITVASDGTIVCPLYAGGATYFQKFTYTKITNTTGTLSLGSQLSIGGAKSATFSSMANGAISAVYQNGANVYVRIINSDNTTSSQINISSGAQSESYSGQFSAASFGGGVVSAIYNAVTTNYPTQIGASTFAATNGSTVITGNSYTPSTGYYLIGVAATDASANSTGQVIMNGVAQLGSTYPTVTTPLTYSYQTTASQPIFGQRGSVAGKTVTLKGLEA